MRLRGQMPLAPSRTPTLSAARAAGQEERQARAAAQGKQVKDGRTRRPKPVRPPSLSARGSTSRFPSI